MPSSITIPYISGGIGKTYDVNTFFTKTDIAGCSINCIYADSCGGTLTGTQVSVTNSVDPWEILAKNDQISGYSKTICL